MVNWKQDLVVGCGLFAVALDFGLKAESYPSDANTFPLVLSIILGILALCLIVKSLFHRRSPAGPLIVLAPYKSVAVQVALIAGFALLIPFIGYLLGGILLCLATAWNGGYANKKIALLFSVSTSVLVFVVFKLILRVPLPKGIFF